MAVDGGEAAGPFRSVRGDRAPSALSPDRLPGGVQMARLADGIEGLIRSERAMAIEMANTNAQTRIIAERLERMTGSVNALVMAQSVPGARVTSPSGQPLATVPSLNPGIPSWMTRDAIMLNTPTVAQAVSQASRGPVQPPAVAPLPGEDFNPVSGQPTGQPRTGVPAEEPSDPRQTVSNWQRFEQGRGYSLGQLRTDIGRGIGSRISGAQFGPNIRQVEGGGWERFDPRTNQSLGEASASDLRNMRLANRVRTVAGNVAEEGALKGIMNALPAGVGKVAGVAGAIYTVANEGLDQAEQQREQNAYWQRITGESNLSGFGERGRAMAFRLSQRGSMSGQMADQLYRGVTEIYGNDERRQDGLDFAVQNWRRFGMEVNDSIELMRISAENGLKSLDGVAASLDGVTQAAKDAGLNTEEARQVFTKNFQAASASLGGTSATIASEAVTNALTGLGETYGNLDTSQVFSSNNLRLLAARQGMGLSQFLASSQGTEGANMLAQAQQSSLTEVANRLIGNDGKALIDQYKRDNGITGPLSEEQSVEVSYLLMQRFGNRLDPEAVTMQIQQLTGIQGITLDQAVPLLVRALEGDWNPTQTTSSRAEAAQQTTLSQEGRSNTLRSSGGGIQTLGDVANAIGIQTGGIGVTQRYNLQGSPSARNQYLDQVAQTGQYSPIIGAMLQQGDSEQRFRINTGTAASPKWEEMSAADAIARYSDQLARGDVQITAGAGKGGTLAEAVGMSPDEGVSVTPGGRTYESAAGATNRVQGQITVAATPELRRLFNIQTDTSRGTFSLTTGTPSSQVVPDGLPSGNR